MQDSEWGFDWDSEKIRPISERMRCAYCGEFYWPEKRKENRLYCDPCKEKRRSIFGDDIEVYLLARQMQMASWNDAPSGFGMSRLSQRLHRGFEIMALDQDDEGD